MSRVNVRKSTPKINIVLVGNINYNLGDAVIADTTYYLLQKALPFLHKDNYKIYHYSFDSEDYEMIAHADLIVFAGGGLIKYKQEKFYKYIPKILEYAQKNDIPVYFNSVGVEGYDESDERCIAIKTAINQSCVKGISVRDDLEILQKYYMTNQKIPLYHVADPAVFTKEVYGTHKDNDSKTIGIGIARSEIFEDYGISGMTKEYQLNMWASFVNEIENMGYKWKLFVNGLNSDYKFAQEVLSYLGKENEADKYLEARPIESYELVKTIAAFKGIISYRMHANIIAYSLGVSSVGLVWNDKLKFWGKQIGYPERFVTKENFNGKYLAECLHKSIEEGIRPQNLKFKASAYKPLKLFIYKYGKRVANKKKKIEYKNEWQNKLLATALGGLNLRYTNMNSPTVFNRSIEGGFEYLEADIRITSDDKLVCINGWSPKMYKNLGIPEGKYDKSGMPYDEFMRCGYIDNHYPTMDMEQLLEMQSTRGEVSLILDIGIPSKDKAEKYKIEFEHVFDKFPNAYDRCIIRLQTKRDVEIFTSSNRKFQLMYFYPGEDVQSVNEVCNKYGIKWISTSIGTYDINTAEQLKKTHKKICVFSCKTFSQVLETAKKGADLIGTYHITPEQMNNMLNERNDK